MIFETLKIFKRSEEGAILVEAAFFMPILIALLLLSIETSRYVLVHQKASRAAATVNDLLARVDDPAAQIDDILSIVPHIMQPFSTADQSLAVATLISRPAGQGTRIVWQDRGAGSAAHSSHYGAIGDSPNLPEGFDLRDNEIVLMTEYFYEYRPLFGFGFWDDTQLYMRAFHKPRLQNLTMLEGNS